MAERARILAEPWTVYNEFSMKGEAIEVMAEVSVVGKDFRVNGLMIYPRGWKQGMPPAKVGPAEIQRIHSYFNDLAKEHGAEWIELQAKRERGANPGMRNKRYRVR